MMKRSIVLVCLLSVTLAADSAISLKKAYWTLSSVGVKRIPLTNMDGALVFDFPVDPADGLKHSANFLTTGRSPVDLSGVTQLSIVASVEAPWRPVFAWRWLGDGTPCEGQAEAIPFFSAYDGLGGYDRWWSPSPYRLYLDQLINQTVELSVPFNPSDWGSADNRSGNADANALAGWQDAIQHVTAIGLSFGGNCVPANGVGVSGGTAQFRLHDYRFQ